MSRTVKTYLVMGIFLMAFLMVLASLETQAASKSNTPIKVQTKHDYCPDIPGIQDLIDGAVICDPPSE